MTYWLQWKAGVLALFLAAILGGLMVFVCYAFAGVALLVLGFLFGFKVDPWLDLAGIGLAIFILPPFFTNDIVPIMAKIANGEEP